MEEEGLFPVETAQQFNLDRFFVCHGCGRYLLRDDIEKAYKTGVTCSKCGSNNFRIAGYVPFLVELRYLWKHKGELRETKPYKSCKFIFRWRTWKKKLHY